MKVWITKYALTRGILELDSETVEGFRVKGDSIYYFEQSGYPQGFHKGEWYENQQMAITKAEEMRQKKLASLKQQIEKLEKIVFEQPCIDGKV